jgi:hypothetical protein
MSGLRRVSSAARTGDARSLLVLDEPLLQHVGGGFEVVAERDQEIDVVVVPLTREAMGKVVARIDGGAHLAARRTEEAKIPFNVFGRRRFVAQAADGDFHRQVVANGPEEFFGDHHRSFMR